MTFNETNKKECARRAKVMKYKVADNWSTVGLNPFFNYIIHAYTPKNEFYCHCYLYIFSSVSS